MRSVCWGVHLALFEVRQQATRSTAVGLVLSTHDLLELHSADGFVRCGGGAGGNATGKATWLARLVVLVLLGWVSEP